MGLRAVGTHWSDDAEAALARLRRNASSDPHAKSIVKRLEAITSVLKSDLLRGEVVKKPLPRELVAKYGVDNLFVEDLPSFWRLIYSVAREGTERHLLILEIVDHTAYDRWFPSRGR